MIHQIDSKNEWLLLSVTFTTKFELVFALTFKNGFLRVFILKPTERALILLQNRTRDFQNRPQFERSACFYVTISESFEHFQYFNFETNFPENENLFRETTKIENTSFLFKTALSEANVNTNRMATTKLIYHKEWSFASNCFIFLENLF